MIGEKQSGQMIGEKPSGQVQTHMSCPPNEHTGFKVGKKSGWMKGEKQCG